MAEKTFTDFDKFGLEPFANQLTKYLQVESQFVDGSFVLSLNSGFGSGKSTFFEMWKNQLDTAKNIFDVVYINAWESDFQGDPLLSIVSQLLKSQPTEKSELKESIKETSGKLGKFALSLGNDFVQKVTGLDIIKAGQYAEFNGGISTSEQGSACFQLYEEKQKLFDKLKKQLGSLTKKSICPILIIVDELDRCRPTYAIEFLETIKHFFDIKKLTFVLGVDKEQLASSAKALFGQQLNFDEYYRKFAHRNITLQVNSQEMTEKFCEKLVDEYLSPEAFKSKNRTSYVWHDSDCTENIVKLCTAFSLNARQMHELFRISAHIFSISVEPNSKLASGWHTGTLFMVALSIKNHDLYEQIGTQKITRSDFTAFLKTFRIFNKDTEHDFWWAALFYLGTFGSSHIYQLEQAFFTLGIWKQKPTIEIQGQVTDFGKELNITRNALFPRMRLEELKVFSKIYKTLEEVKTFEKQ